MTDSETFTAFLGPDRIAQAERETLAQILRAAGHMGHVPGLLIFSDRTGRETDLDLAGSPPPPRRGRPRLGVVSREVTLLPRHWDWLARQRGGASATLRRLVEDAARGEDPGPARRDAAFRFCNAIAGNLPGFETAMRALYAGDTAGFTAAMDAWPTDIRTHALTLAGETP